MAINYDDKAEHRFSKEKLDEQKPSPSPRSRSHRSQTEKKLLVGWWMMAKTNKFTSINFNHIYDKSNNNPNPNTRSNPIKNPSPSPSSSSSSSSSSYSAVSSPKPHGRMLVLTRPTTPKPKPISAPPSLPLQQTQQPPARIRSDAISLRPLGQTGSGSVILPAVQAQDKDKETSTFSSSPKPDKFVPPHLRPGFVGHEDRSRETGQKHHFGPPGRPRSPNGNRPTSSGCYSKYGGQLSWKGIEESCSVGSRMLDGQEFHQ